MDANSSDGSIIVNIAKRKLGGVGFVTSKRSESPYLVVSHVVKGGVAHETGLIQTGDVILEVDGKSVESMPYHKALEIIDKVPTGEVIAMKLRAKDGFQAYLETAFDDKGSVKTVRKNRPRTPSTPKANKDLNGEVNGESHMDQAQTTQVGPVSTSEDAGKKHHVENEDPEAPPSQTMANGHPENESEILSESLQSKGCPVTNFLSKPQNPKYVRLQNLLDGKYTTDTLHQKAMIPINCTAGRCLGSLMQPYGGEAAPKRLYGVPRQPEEVIVQAKDFLQQYYGAMKLENSSAHKLRLGEVMKEIEKTGTYELTEKELIFGCRMAWRNAPRCIGRIQWNKLQVFDARHVNTPSEMFEAICKHIKYGTNKGNIRSTITVFPQRKTAFKDFRVWNTQLIRYAGYKKPDGSCIGDPSNIEFTEICQSLGWEGKGGPFDVLPLILQANGGEPEMFEIPPEIVLEVEIKHPKYPWFEELGLKWYALPAVSCLCLDVGGVEIPACPFNGWYMVTEIGARDFGDTNRYNMLEPVAQRMGLDTKSNASLWKDLAMVEINVAVMHSFQEAGVTMTDHHSASESFLKHLENEVKLRGGCPGDWVWIVPPMSGSATQVFHQEMLNYTLKPSYEYQDDPWKHYSIKKDTSSGSPRKKASFKEVAKAVKFSAKLFSKALAKRQKAVILYATETGKSERYAKMLGELFSHAFDPKVVCMQDYANPEMENEQLVLIVTSTFGNGDPPENGEEFARYLYELRHPPDGSRSSRNMMKQLGSLLVQKEKEKRIDVMNNSQPLANLRYSVFGLGSRAYPNFCAFARSLDKIIRELGGEPVLKMGEGDELCGQEESFKMWAKDVFKAACDSFCISDEITNEASQSLDTVPSGWAPGRFRLATIMITAVHAFTEATDGPDGHSEIVRGLTHICGKTVRSATLLSVKNLQSPESSRSTISVRLKTENSTELQYKPGDHVAIFPANRPELVQALIDRLSDDVDPDKSIVVEASREVKGILKTAKKWETYNRLPSQTTLRQALSRYLDVTSVPSPQILKALSATATDPAEKEKLEILSQGNNRYEDWKFGSECNILDVLQEHPSLRVPADLLLTQLPLLQPRFYSISSSPDFFPGEVHLTVAVVQYNKRGGKGPVHHGVCSTWLNSLQPGDKVACYVRQAQTFHLPEDGTVPVIMVGPGTGIAPFRSFWQQRQFDIVNTSAPKPRTLDLTPDSSPLIQRRNFAFTRGDSPETTPPTPHRSFGGSSSLQRQLFSEKEQDENASQPSSGKWGEMLLFFGCRNSTQDYIYKDEMAKAKNDGALTEIWTALSREPGQPKKYVQDMLKMEAFDICDKLLSQRGHFYVCGDVSMAEDVCRTLQTLLQEYAAMSQQEAQDTVNKMKSSGRYHEDIFGVTLKTREVTDRVRTAAKRSWMYLKTSSKMRISEHKLKPRAPTITLLMDRDGAEGTAVQDSTRERTYSNPVH